MYAHTHTHTYTHTHTHTHSFNEKEAPLWLADAMPHRSLSFSPYIDR